jgi:ubiquinone/menaquinone biosynthesis C-methylase UbiE
MDVALTPRAPNKEHAMTQIVECPAIVHAITAKPDLSAIKARQQAMWASGDFAVIGTTLQIVGEALCESADLAAGATVLDVACGNGNATLAAARRFCKVTGLDYVPALLERAAERARAERLEITFTEGDAEHLPFADTTYDCVLSTFGVMFAPDQRQAAKELTRVTKPGAKIALASWTPDGFLGDLLRTVARYAPPPAGVASPLRWGSAQALAELFGDTAVVVRAEKKQFLFHYLSPAHFVDVFRRFYGPTHKAFESLDGTKQAALAADITQLVTTHNRDRAGAVAVPGEYLEIVLEKR